MASQGNKRDLERKKPTHIWVFCVLYVDFAHTVRGPGRALLARLLAARVRAPSPAESFVFAATLIEVVHKWQFFEHSPRAEA